MVVTTGDSGTGLMNTRRPLASVAVRMPSYRAAATRKDGSGAWAGDVGASSTGNKAMTPRASRLGTERVMRNLARRGSHPRAGPSRGPVLRLRSRAREGKQEVRGVDRRWERQFQAASKSRSGRDGRT